MRILETNFFIETLRQFTAGRFAVHKIWFDKGSNCVGAKKKLRVLTNKRNQTSITKSLLQKETSWSVNTSLTLHHEGERERCVRSV